MSLSFKKPKTKNLRNVLVSPLNIKYDCFENNHGRLSALQNVLEEWLPLAKVEKKSLKPISKGMKDKNDAETSSLTKHSNIFRTHLALGFQSVIRGLERGELCSVVMAGDISPVMIPNVVCSYCHTHNIPLAVVPQLKSITKSALGFPTMVFGLKKTVDSPENKFFTIHNVVLQNKCNLKSPFEGSIKDGTTPEKEGSCQVVSNEIVNAHPAKTKDIYLYRDTVNERVFRPECGIKNDEAKAQVIERPKHGFDADFISFNQNEVKSSKSSNSNILKPTSHENSDGDEVDCDSLDEDNIFFVDSQPDHKLLDSQLSSDELMDSQTSAEVESLDSKSVKNTKTENIAKKKSKIHERYFSNTSQLTVVTKKNKSRKKKDSKIHRQNLTTIVEQNMNKHKQEIEAVEKDKQVSQKNLLPTFNPLTIKTIISNPKKTKRKKNNR